MEKGTVVHFNTKERFGFVRTLRGEELFFHLSDGLTMDFQDGPCFIYIDKKKPTDIPRKNDVICFERTEGRKGPKAAPWGFEYQFKQARRKVGLQMLPNCQDLIDRFPCLPDIFAEAKRVGDMNPFTVEEQCSSALRPEYIPHDSYMQGLRCLWYIIAWEKTTGWSYRALEYSGYRAWGPDGRGYNYQTTLPVLKQLSNLSQIIPKPLAVVAVNTNLESISNNLENGSVPRQQRESGKISLHKGTVFVF